MLRTALASALISFLLLPSIVLAQALDPQAEPGRLRPDHPAFVLPMPPPEAAARDAQRVADELAAQRRGERLLREQGIQGLTPSRRPDLDLDVVQNIQSRAIHRALHR